MGRKGWIEKDVECSGIAFRAFSDLFEEDVDVLV